jgi:uncharacterized protein (TIGR02271 family)
VRTPTSNDEPRPTDNANEAVLPLLAEEVAVSKQVVETGRVQVTRVTHQHEQLIDELLAIETAEIERTPIGRQVDVMPAVREEGDAIVVPIVEEVLVVERRLFLKEELRIRRVRSTKRHQETVTLRHHEAVVTRVPVEAPAAGESPASGEQVHQSNQE